MFAYLVSESRLFRYNGGAVRLINTLTYLLNYLLTNQFLLITIYGIIFKLRGGKILLEGLECNKDAQMKTYGITKLTVEMKSDSVPTKK